MATSGTTDFNLDMAEAIEDAFERCGLDFRSGYDARTARRSINLLFADWANRGINMWTIEERTEPLVFGQASYELDSDIVDLIENVVQIPPTNNQVTRYHLSRVSVSTFANRTNPDITGRPTEIYINRQREAPIVHLWPLPDGNGPYTLVYWVLRRVEDAGGYTNTADIPFRFLESFISGLAFMIASKKRLDDPGLISRLESSYERAWQRAADEDREKATFRAVPSGSAYRVR